MTQEHDAETVERMAAAMWRAETVESGTPESVTLRRTPQMFRDLGETNRTKWIKFARAALSAMPAREVTVREAARVLLKDMQTRLPSVETYDDPVFSSIYEFDTTSYVLNALAGEKP